MLQKKEIVQILENSTVSDRLKNVFFGSFSTSYEPIMNQACLTQADVVFVTNHIHIDIIKDIIAIKTKNPQKKCCIFSTEPCRSYVANLCSIFVDDVIIFSSAFELATLLSQVKPGTPVITRHRVPKLVFVTYSFPFKHIYKPYGFLYTTKLKGSWENYLRDDSGFAEMYMIQKSASVYHLEGNVIGSEIKNKFGRSVTNIYPGCMEYFTSKIYKKSWDGKNDPHFVYFSSNPHKLILPYLKSFEMQRIHLHIYLPYYYFDESYLLYKDMKIGLAAILNEVARNPYFHIHSELPYTKLVNEVSQYDFALPFFDVTPTPSYTPIASNFFMALEANLPLIVPENSIGMKEFIEKYQLGLALKMDEITNLRDTLLTDNRIPYKENIIKVSGQELKFNIDALNSLIF